MNFNCGSRSEWFAVRSPFRILNFLLNYIGIGTDRANFDSMRLVTEKGLMRIIKKIKKAQTSSTDKKKFRLIPIKLDEKVPFNPDQIG